MLNIAMYFSTQLSRFVKSLADVRVRLCRCLQKSAPQFIRQFGHFFRRDLPCLDIALVSNKYDWFRRMHVSDLIVISFNAREGCSGSNVVDKDECIVVADPLFTQSFEIAAARVENFQKTRLTTYDNQLSVRVFDCGIVL